MRLKLILGSFALAMLVGGCGLQNTFKHLQSSVVGLDRQITLYSSDGKIIKTWRTRAKVEDRGGTCWFICNGKAVTVSGTFLVEEQ